ncbi:EamA family transporter [Pyrobaculum aerophilum]|uniref:Conserved within P. aerophilum n=1 Tax=Pyrobaculum aerophilum (strain ATCC 51768 / DSM 7523 / JCM 9630 / CIP 104966 / NBRC 100827 / IM2) TaxID=178306 RepID=Q8ZSY5_PYRAE|nr:MULTISPECIES: EamA family transporter [Pyrobaculum]AAL64978.1 conserved within P. aerophilum [Pyrobaculum aerophilum str. IM2]MCX8137335.1 EamA family transporter [Pyrobaculum aerophilum]
MIDITLSIAAAVAYGVAPLVYRPALQCTNQFRAMSVFSTYSILLGLLLPWDGASLDGVLSAAAAALFGGVLGSWLYVTAVKIGGAAVGNISSSLYVVLLPIAAGKLALIPAALLVLLGSAIASSYDVVAKRGAFYGVVAAFVWTGSIMLYASAVRALGPGGALFTRGVIVLLATLLLGFNKPLCEAWRLVVGGFIDTFIGFGAYTSAIFYGDYVSATLIMSSYPLISALLEKPFMWRRVAGALAAVAGLVLVALTNK